MSINTTKAPRNVCLVVIDGWGLSPTDPILTSVPDTPEVSTLHPNLVKYDAIANAKTDVMSTFQSEFPTVPLYAHGSHVGLPHGLMGNSEVGHLNIGSGRPVPQVLYFLLYFRISFVLIMLFTIKHFFPKIH